MLAGADRGVPVGEAHRPEARVWHEHEIAARVDALVPRDEHVAGDGERQLRGLEREAGGSEGHAAGRGEDHVSLERPVRRRLERVLGRALDRDAAVEPHAELVEGRPAEIGQRIVEAVEGPLEHVDERHGVTGLGERRSALGSDQAGSDDDHLDRAAREQRTERVEDVGVRVDEGAFEARDRRRAIRKPGRENDALGLDGRLTVARRRR